MKAVLITAESELPRARSIFARQEAGEDRDEGRRQRAARDEGEEQIGQAEGRVIRIEFGAGADRARQDQIVEDAGDFADQKARADDERGDEDAASGFGEHIRAKPARLGRLEIGIVFQRQFQLAARAIAGCPALSAPALCSSTSLRCWA